jgi:hypothetical protein
MEPTGLQILIWSCMFLLALGVLGLLFRVMTKPVGIAIVLALLGWLMYFNATGQI